MGKKKKGAACVSLNYSKGYSEKDNEEKAILAALEAIDCGEDASALLSVISSSEKKKDEDKLLDRQAEAVVEKMINREEKHSKAVSSVLAAMRAEENEAKDAALETVGDALKESVSNKNRERNLEEAASEILAKAFGAPDEPEPEAKDEPVPAPKSAVEKMKDQILRQEKVKNKGKDFRTTVRVDLESPIHSIQIIDRIFGTFNIIIPPEQKYEEYKEKFGLITDDMVEGLFTDQFISDLATFITVCTSPTAIFTEEEFAEFVDENNITGFDSNSLALLSNDSGYIYGYQFFRAVEIDVRETLKRLGPSLFWVTLSILLPTLSDCRVMNGETARVKDTCLDLYTHDNPLEDERKKNFIDYMIKTGSRLSSSDLEHLGTWDYDDYVYSLSSMIASLVNILGNEEAESEEDYDDEDDVPEFNSQEFLNNYGKEPEKEVKEPEPEVKEEENKNDNGRRYHAPEIGTNVGEAIRAMGGIITDDRKTESRGGKNSGRMVQNKQTSGGSNSRKEERNIQSGRSNGHQQASGTTAEKEEEKEKETQQKAQSRHDQAGHHPDRQKEQKAQEEKQEAQKEQDGELGEMVIPVRRG